MDAPRHDAITDVPGIRVGHSTDLDAATGCTVVLCDGEAVAGVDQRGGAPGTRETDALRPLHIAQQAHAVVLAGGSAYGLAAADGVMTYLEQQDVGVDVGVARVPVVPAAILLDLGLGRADVRPDAAMGRAAAEAAASGPVPQGSVGAGTGARVGLVYGPQFCMKGGMGTASVDAGGGVTVGALIAVNCFGDVIDPATGQIVAGARRPPEGAAFAGTLEALAALGPQVVSLLPPGATVIGVVATNAKLTREGANKVAQMAHNGLAMAIRPAHTMLDGDTLFALATGELEASVSVVGAFAAEAVAKAIVNAVRSATTVHGCLAAADFTPAD